VRHRVAALQALLQPAQLPALQEEQPDDIVCVEPSLERDTPLKLEKSLSTSCDWQSGHEIPLSDDPNTSFSNSVSHFWHRYSNIGIANHSSNAMIVT
jgi:hypothetical protein